MKYKKVCQDCGWESREYTEDERNHFIGVGGCLVARNAEIRVLDALWEFMEESKLLQLG